MGDRPPRTRRQFFRYLVAGFANTAFTYLLLLLLMRAMDYRIAYTVAYVVGIVLAYVLYSRYVFEVPLGVRKALGFPLVYALQWIIGVAALSVLVEAYGMAREVAALVVVAMNVPIGFVLSRLWLARG